MTPSRQSAGLSPRLYLVFLTPVLAYATFAGRDLAPWNACLLALGLAAALYWLFTPLARLAPPPRPWLRWAVLLFPSYAALQLLPLPFSLVRMLSPERAWLLDSLRPLAPPPAFAALSASASNGCELLFRMAACTLTFLLVRDIAWRFWEQRSWAPVIPLLAVAAVQAGLGVYQGATGPVVHGTYPNRNHFAGLLEMVLPFAVAYGFALLGDARLYSPALRAFKACAALALAALIFVALLQSLSKMGFAAGLLGVLVMAALALASSIRGWKKALIIPALAAVFLLAFVFLPSDQLVGTFGETLAPASDLENRWPIWVDTLHLIRAYPLFGSGLGTYNSVFTKFKTGAPAVGFVHAHNDYLEFAAELGAFGFLILAAILSAVFWSALRAATRGPDRHTRCLGLASAGALTAIALHSLVDFNMYVRANAMVLAWICGIAASLSGALPARLPDPPLPGRVFCRRLALALACLLIVYAPAWIVFETSYLRDPRAESLFCRFGICATDMVLAAQVPPGTSPAPALFPTLLEYIRRDPASQPHWYYLCQALKDTAPPEQVAYCFSHMLALGPEIPPVLLIMADFYAGAQQNPQALQLVSHVLARTSYYDPQAFTLLKEWKFPAATVLSALPPGPRPAEAYLRYIMADLDRAVEPNLVDAALVWDWMLLRRYVDARLASDYTDFLFRRRQFQEAAQSWAAWLGNRRHDYLQPNRVYDGDFESPPSVPSRLDWKVEKAPDVEVARDSSVAHTGSHSLRIRFAGRENIFYHHISQDVPVSPGTYRFEAFVQTREITTSKGIGFSISDSEVPSRVNVLTEQLTGTNGWQKITQTIHVPSETNLLTISVIRQPVVLKFDDRISGTAWIDSVSLSKLP